jgi:hypothetical protein
VPGARTIAIGLAIGLAGTLPLLLYIALGPADGNPIGLGLLAAAALPVGGLVVLGGLVRLIVHRARAARP